MSAPWSILVIVFGGLIAAANVALEGGEHLRGADRLVDGMVRERES